MNKCYIVETQNLEEYGENIHKFKGGQTYIITFESTREVYEEDAFGKGMHEYYMCDSLSEPSAAALVMKHVNKANGLRGSFDYIVDIKLDTTLDLNKDYCDWWGTKEELINELSEAELCTTC